MTDRQFFIGYSPKPWQTVVHQAITNSGPSANKIFVVKSPRQIGKSFLIEMELLRHAIDYKNSVNICVSITFSNCKKIFQELRDGIIDSGIMTNCNNQGMEITLITGSTIIFKSAQQRESLRGYTIKNNGILCIDEAAYIPDDIFSIIFPWTNVNHSNILMVSTPRIKQGIFYDYFTEGLNGSDIVQSFDLSKFDTSEMLPPEKVEFYRKKMPRMQFITEILGDFSEAGAGVFDISKDIWLPVQSYPFDDIFIGIDWGTGSNGDYTVLSGFDASGKQVLLEKTNTLTPTEQINWIVNIVRQISKQKIRKILCERNSIGSVYFDMLKNTLSNYPIEDFVTSNSSKREIIEYMIQRFEQSDIKLLNDKEQYLQFGAYAMEITNNGSITYNGLPGTHDDCVMAAAFALKCIKDLSASSYNISFAHKKIKTRKWN